MARTYTMQVSSIIAKARAMINDDTQLISNRTTDEELIGWINDALNVLLNIRPGLFTQTIQFTCAAGYQQEVMTDRAVQFIEVVGVPRCDRDTLTQFMPNWNNNTIISGQMTNWMVEPSDPLRFDVYPPAINGAVVTIRIVQSPVKLTSSSDIINLSENYEAMIAEYVAGRSQIRDDEHVNSNRASLLMDRFVAQAKGI